LWTWRRKGKESQSWRVADSFMMMMVGPEAGSFPCWLEYAATSGP
jgi:hypothetical protein